MPVTDEAIATEETTSDDEIAAMQAKLDAAKKAKAEARAKLVSDAMSRGEPAPKPNRDGAFEGEVVEGFPYRWDRKSRSWVAFSGVDRTKQIPEGFEHVGDGSRDNPHNVTLANRW